MLKLLPILAAAFTAVTAHAVDLGVYDPHRNFRDNKNVH